MCVYVYIICACIKVFLPDDSQSLKFHRPEIPEDVKPSRLMEQLARAITMCEVRRHCKSCHTVECMVQRRLHSWAKQLRGQSYCTLFMHNSSPSFISTLLADCVQHGYLCCISFYCTLIVPLCSMSYMGNCPMSSDIGQLDERVGIDLHVKSWVGCTIYMYNKSLIEWV